MVLRLFPFWNGLSSWPIQKLSPFKNKMIKLVIRDYSTIMALVKYMDAAIFQTQEVSQKNLNSFLPPPSPPPLLALSLLRVLVWLCVCMCVCIHTRVDMVSKQSICLWSKFTQSGGWKKKTEMVNPNMPVLCLKKVNGYWHYGLTKRS